MNREDIIRMAWKAGFERLGHTGNDWVCYPEDIERFAALVASAERERILDMCKEGLWDAEGIRYHLDKQARGQA